MSASAIVSKGLAPLALAALVACGDASTEVSGGVPRFDAAAPQATGTGGTGTTWSSLYGDLFGPSGAASCKGSGACHGDGEQAGALGSGGFVCADKDGCVASLKSVGLVKDSDKGQPDNSAFYRVLRRVENGQTLGLMPKSPAYVFSDGDLARIKTWIANGAPND